MLDDPDRCYDALRARDPRFDGWFVVGVTSTGIYCRPSCPARTPRRENVRFLSTAAAAQRGGFRACKRCRPDASPGSPAWDHRADLVGRAMRLIADGVVDRDGVPGLAARLGYSPRQVHRELCAEVGAGPLALARAQRAHAARVLIETTDLPFAEVAFGAGFGSVRQFNDTIREVFAATPTGLRRGAGRGGATGTDTITLRLAHREPAALRPAIEHLAARAVPGLEQVMPDGTYRRSLALPHGTGVVALTPAAGHVRARLHLDELRDLAAAVQRCRRLLDLDADPEAIDAHLARDAALAPLVAATPGLRVVRGVDPFEVLVRTVVGQQISVAAARQLTSRLVARVGRAIARPRAGVGRVFPDAGDLGTAELTGIGLTDRRRVTLQAVARAVAEGELVLDVGGDRERLRHQLAQLPGIGPWTVEEVALRGMGDPDALPATDLVLRRVAGQRGLPDHPVALTRRAAAWRPWRAYAAQHLWLVAARSPARAA